MHKVWLLLFSLFFLASCEYFTSPEKKTQQLVNDELLTIDWNKVDAYPLFENCDETVSKQAQRECFETTMLEHFSAAFADLEYLVQNDLNQQLYIDFLVDEHGFITISQVEENDVISNAIPGFYNEINSRLNDLTTVKPAHKRGTPVSIKFRLPIVLNTN
jgi:hypothetical protein